MSESRSSWKTGLGAGLIGILIGGAVVAFATGKIGSTPGRAQTEQIVRDYVLAHPELIPEAMQRLQDRELAKVVGADRAAYETPYAGAWAGAEKGDVVLVEFFDYACGFCRASNADVDRLLREDKNLKVVWRELPVLGPDSQAAAQASLAAARQGRFRDFHERLFALGRPQADAIRAAQQAVGLDAASIDATAATAEIEKNFELARAINASGTPTFMVGDKVLQGAVGYQALKDAIAAARES